MQGSDRKVPHRTECIFTDRTVVYEIVCRTIIAEEWEKARKILAENREKLDELAMYLYEKETITGDEFMDILDRK